MNKQQAYQFAAVLGQLGALGDPGMQKLGASAVSNAQGAAQAEELKKQKEEEDKKRRSGIFGSIGGTAAALLAAPFTAGMSLPAAALVSGGAAAAGNAAGQFVGGGGVDPTSVLTSGAVGAVTPFVANALTPAAKVAMNPVDPTAPFDPAVATPGVTPPAGTMVAQDPDQSFSKAAAMPGAVKTGYVSKLKAMLPAHMAALGLLNPGQRALVYDPYNAYQPGY